MHPPGGVCSPVWEPLANANIWTKDIQLTNYSACFMGYVLVYTVKGTMPGRLSPPKQAAEMYNRW